MFAVIVKKVQYVGHFMSSAVNSIRRGEHRLAEIAGVKGADNWLEEFHSVVMDRMKGGIYCWGRK